jgi:uncharacterized protein (DUF302 family)
VRIHARHSTLRSQVIAESGVRTDFYRTIHRAASHRAGYTHREAWNLRHHQSNCRNYILTANPRAANYFEQKPCPGLGEIHPIPSDGASAGKRDRSRKVTTKRIEVQRFTVISSKSFQDVLAKLDAAIGHPNMATFRTDMTSAKTFAPLEAAVQKVIGSAGLMEFARFDLGEVLRGKIGERAPKSMRLVIGNPLIMAQMVEHVPDAGSYAPVTILVDERPDGVHLTYDTMASFLSSYGSAKASKVAEDLDAKVETLLTAAAA